MAMEMEITPRPIQPRMIVIGADATLVGEVSRVGSDAITVRRTPLPSITLPIGLVAEIDDDVVVLDVSGDLADSVGEDYRRRSLL